ncbi:phage tail protein [Liquorilactobacillus nagelii]|uniref:phage tail protein n=1 Tax=Liquorilactobacillus nagelii TaxID=82688 RepID=UPI0024320975|nr:phage tail protein [Liquorilactobacillus nagelii]MCI1699986.1 phage tail protein [Liquorilactobacillus nagelii]
MIDTNMIKQARYMYSDGANLFQSVDGLTYNSIGSLQSGITANDMQVIKIYDYYYFIGTLALFKTKDFTNYTSIDISEIASSDYSKISHLRLFADANNQYHISYTATNSDNTSAIYVADFNIANDTIANAYQEVTVSDSYTDAHIICLNNKYFMFLEDNRIFVSDNYLNNYTELATNINNGTNSYTEPFCLVAGDYLYLYAVKNNTDLVYRVARKVNPIIWSNEAKIVGLSKVGGFWFNDALYSTLPETPSLEDTFDPVVIVKALHVNQKAILSCLLWDTFQVQWSQNSTYQLQLTAYDDRSISYALLQSETSIFFNDQEYIIKTCEPDYSAGVNTKQITATHVYNEIQYVRQYSTRTGTLTYSVADVLAFYLDNNSNNIGFTYQVYGDFAKQQITDLGNNSGKDMLSQILSTWTNAIIFPDNRQINVYTPDAFSKNFGRRIDYLNNTQEVKMTMDSTSITNKVYCIGKTKENSTDNSTTEYYFQPFFVSDQNSINNWGLHPMDDINDERFTDANSMKTYAQGQLKTEPALSVEVTYKTNEVPLAGETRHIKVNDDYETDVTVIGFTWYPFSGANQTVLEFDNLPASILNTQALINNRIRDVELIAQKALNQATTATVNYISDADPNNNNTVRVGDLWTRKLEGGDT